MKTKKVSKKLALNQKTIANLKDSEMKDVYGGDDKPTYTYCLPISIRPIVCH